MIQSSAFRYVKWIALSVFAAILGLKVYSAPDDIIGIALTAAGLVAYSVSLAFVLFRKDEPQVLWDSERGIIAVVRTWDIEVASASILSSVPLGIDLSHSGRKVLQSMYTRYLGAPGGVLVFFITRPINNQSTRVGFLVRRRVLRFGKSLKQVNRISQTILTDGIILERAMRAAYPHLPVTRAGFDDILTTQTGGLQTHVLI